MFAGVCRIQNMCRPASKQTHTHTHSHAGNAPHCLPNYVQLHSILRFHFLGVRDGGAVLWVPLIQFECDSSSSSTGGSAWHWHWLLGVESNGTHRVYLFRTTWRSPGTLNLSALRSAPANAKVVIDLYRFATQITADLLCTGFTAGTTPEDDASGAGRTSHELKYLSRCLRL